MTVALFITCLTESFYPRAGVAVVKVLEHLGHDVAFPRAQTCCGQPMYNNGHHDEARTLARRMVRVFDGYEHVVTPSASCAAMLREHAPRLFEAGTPERRAADDLASRTREFVEFLVNVEKLDVGKLAPRWEGAATYHYSCHLRDLGMTDEALRVAGAVEGLSLTPLDRADQCCGFGGTFATSYPQISGGMVADKVARIRATGAGTVISNEAGCTMNMAGACRRAGHEVAFRSLAEILAEGLGLLPRDER